MPDPISWSDALPWYLGALLGGYLFGSIPFGLIFTRMAGLGDIRDIGSGNIGATNALRTGNKAVALGTLIFDALKGGIALYIAGELGGPDCAVLAALGTFSFAFLRIALGLRGLGLGWSLSLLATTCTRRLQAARKTKPEPNHAHTHAQTGEAVSKTTWQGMNLPSCLPKQRSPSR